MRLDINQLKALRDNIDTYLASEDRRDEAVKQEVHKIIDTEFRPLLDEFKQVLSSAIKEE